MGMLTAHEADALLEGSAETLAPLDAGQLIPPEAVRSALRKMLASAGFVATERSRRLLEYLVTEALEGRAGRIKAYCIGTQVFGRPASFDPQKDPIVRIEAGRLRRELEHYYLTDGRDDPVMIDVPKGAYVPRFFNRESAVPPEPAQRIDALARAIEASWWTGPRAAIAAALLLALMAVLVAGVSLLASDRRVATAPVVHIPGLLVKPLTDLTHSRDSGLLAQGLTERIIEKTSRFKELEVIASDVDAVPVSAVVARYEFGGTLRTEDGRLSVQTRLADRMDGKVIWADSFNVPLQPQQLFDVERTIADQIATRLAEPSGIVFEAERRMMFEAPPESLNSYLCTLRAYAYRASFAANQFADVRSCLERAVAEHPDYATAWALLSLAYIDEFRFSFPPDDNAVPALTRAYDAARRAADLDPTSIRAQQALMMALFFRKDYAEGIDVGERALALNPNDVELKGDFGHRLALFGDWDKGCRLVKEALDSSARKIGYYKTVLALCDFYKNDVQAAAEMIRQADAGENPAYHVVAAAILAEAGDTAGVEDQRNWLQQNAPRQLPQLLVSLPDRLVRPMDRERFLAALRKAGFALPQSASAAEGDGQSNQD